MGDVMNKREKGLTFQQWIKKWLEERGWTVRNFSPTSKPIYSKKFRKIIYVSVNNDFWGADLIARKLDRNNQIRQLVIQASLSTGIQKRIDEFHKYYKKLMPGEMLQIWIKTDKGVINIKECFIAFNEIQTSDIGKIIRRKFFCTEGVQYEF